MSHIAFVPHFLRPWRKADDCIKLDLLSDARKAREAALSTGDYDKPEEPITPVGAAEDGKQISNPFSTGGGGPWFEVQVMSAFATLMLGGSYAPCLGSLPIRSIKLQARHAGYRVDDFVVHATDANQTKSRKMLAQVKHGIGFSKSNWQFRDTISAAWKDYNDSAKFTHKADVIAIIAGPLNATDVEDTRRILEWARSQESSHEFFSNVQRANFSSDGKRDKLAAFRANIDMAAGAAVSDGDVFEFLRHVHVIGFDLDVYSGMMHALLHGIIGRHSPDDPGAIWARILQHVGSLNPNAGTLTVASFPDDIQMAFRPRPVEMIPPSLALTVPPQETPDWNTSEFAEALTVANLLGAWSETSKADMAVVSTLKAQPDEWMRKMREVLQHPDSPLAYENGVWSVKNRVAFWGRFAGRIFEDSLKLFEQCALTVLSERDPRFDLEPEQRYAAQIFGKVTAHSWPLRNGIAETLALLGTNASPLPNCALAAGERAAAVVVRRVLDQSSWELWASLGRLLPTFAEAAPKSFLAVVENALRQEPCPFDAIFAQERDVMSGGTHMSGLLWALEALAWDESFLVRVSVILAMLAALDPGGKWANRPSQSLTTIFLPWLPQTLAPPEKRTVAVRAIVRERPAVGWRLLMSLLPQHQSTSAGTYKPRWRYKLEFDALRRPPNEEYWAQISSYAQIVLEIVRSEPHKLKDVIGSLDSLTEPALNEVLAFTRSDSVSGLTDEDRLPIWTKLSSLARKHRRHAKADWALPAEVVDEIEAAAATLMPQDPAVKHRQLFGNSTWELYDDEEEWEKGEEQVAKRRMEAIQEVFQKSGVEGVTAFATHVENPSAVGLALGRVASCDITNQLLQKLILSPNLKLRELAHGLIWVWWREEKWEWFDKLDFSDWSKDQIAQFLIYLPFEVETWVRSERLLGGGAMEYWSRVPVGRFHHGPQEIIAVDSLLKHERPRAAVALLASRVDVNLQLDPDRAIEALLASVSSSQLDSTIDPYVFARVIKALQETEGADTQKVMTVEWAYLALLEDSHVTKPKRLNAALVDDPHFFCDVIRRIFRSDHEPANGTWPEPSPDEQAIGQNAYRLLRSWSKVPGTDASGEISAKALTAWIDTVKTALEASGHLDVGLHKAGEVFIHAPPDPDGLFIHRAAAEVLNREDMQELRHGYELAIYNSRGVHFVDPTGAPELKLSQEYSLKAEAAENAGYYRLAIALRSIAEDYARESELTKKRFADRNRSDGNS